jgi:hypothetical protein
MIDSTVNAVGDSLHHITREGIVHRFLGNIEGRVRI